MSPSEKRLKIPERKVMERTFQVGEKSILTSAVKPAEFASNQDLKEASVLMTTDTNFHGQQRFGDIDT